MEINISVISRPLAKRKCSFTILFDGKLKTSGDVGVRNSTYYMN